VSDESNDVQGGGEGDEPTEAWSHLDDDQLQEVAERAHALLSDEAFVYAVEQVIARVKARTEGFPLDLCVDQEMEVEITRNWNRNDPPNPFGLLTRLKEERPGSWVSPSMSLRMLAVVESLARNAYNEATRA
jgi:hypothetical protein